MAPPNRPVKDKVDDSVGEIIIKILSFGNSEALMMQALKVLEYSLTQHGES